MSIEAEAGRVAVDILDVLKTRCINDIITELGSTDTETSSKISAVLNQTFATFQGTAVDTITGTVIRAMEEGKKLGPKKTTRKKSSTRK